MAGNEDEWQVSEGMYKTFLLRCWQESDGLNEGETEGFHNWRFNLVQINDPSQTKCFASLEELVDYLRGRLKGAASESVNSSADSFR